jgi:hypothetical protein
MAESYYINSAIRNNKNLIYNNEKAIVLDFFRFIKNKDIGNLMDLFAPDAIVYEPFSKITGGLKGKLAIESFLRIAIIANDTLQHRVVFEKEYDTDETTPDLPLINNSTDNAKVSTLIIFEKGDSIKARFTFELTSDNRDNAHTAPSIKYNRIKTLGIQFL